MESDEVHKTGAVGTSTNDIDSQGAVNSLILDYYKKFGRKRDLEQFFSLSTAQSDIKDTSGLFWRKMKSENDSSDSGGRRSDSSAQELCRISIKCSMPEPSSSQSDDPKTNTASPPIITEEAPADISRQTDDESLKSDDNNSQKSFDPLLDLSAHKPLSPTSSITSQRKLEWDSLADVGYGNESDRKTSASSLSTLERLALQQQYSNNDSKDIGAPTCHSTPVDENEAKSKSKKGAGRKMTRIIKKDVDFVEVNVPHTSDTIPPQSINVNLTKHISFNVEKDGGITVDNIRKDVNVSPEKVTVRADVTPPLPVDKESQTSLPKTKDKSSSSIEEPKPLDINTQKIPVMISLNTIKKRLRRKKSKIIRRRYRTRMKIIENQDIPIQEKSGEQLSEAESFEYMPGHIYNQNQMKANEANHVIESRPDHNSTAGNKSSLESSGGITTDSSKASKQSLTKDLEKCIDVLKVTLQKRFDDGEMKKKLIKEIVQRLLNSKYRDDETTTEFLSGLSFNSKKLDSKENNTTTSTSDANNTDDSKQKRPKKSILRMDKFDSNVVASTSQSVPNLFTATSTEKTNINLIKMLTSNTESDESSRGKTSSDNALPKTSSEELYLKYLEALRREESYKRHLRDKEVFLKQKLGSLDTAFKAPLRQDTKINNKLKDLMKDLTRNNYDDGSGDASKLEGGSSSDRNIGNYNETGRCQRSHSVFTLSSSHSGSPKKANLRKKMQVDRDLDSSNSSKNHYCCCPHHSGNAKVGYVDSSVQVNIKYQHEDESNENQKQDQLRKCSNCEKCESSPRNVQHINSENANNEIRRYCEECTGQEKPKQSPQSGCSNCPKCGKKSKNMVDTDNDPSINCQKCYRSPRNIAKMVPDKNTGEIKYVCVCKGKPSSSTTTGDFMIYKCSKLTNRGIQFEDPSKETNACAQCDGSCKSSNEDRIQSLRAPYDIHNGTNSIISDNTSNIRRHSQSSQTNMLMKMISKRNSEQNDDPQTVNLYGTSTGILVELRSGKKAVVIHEATRSLQTEISINPKIPDPSLSDIVIINDCAELISEQPREVTCDTDTCAQKKTFSDVYTTSTDSGKFLLRSSDSEFGADIKDYDIKIIESKNSSITRTEKPPNDYTIPIHGTNMTLMVTLASSGKEENKEQVDLGVGTTRAFEQGICSSSADGKSVQRQCNTATNSTKNTFPSADYNSNKSSLSSKASPRKSCLSKPPTLRSPHRNTYPKTVVLKDKKPFRRSNTDTGKLEMRCDYAQTEPFKYSEPLMNRSDYKTDTSESYKMRITADKLERRSTSSRSSEEEASMGRKEIGIQKDLSEDEFYKKRTTPEMVSKGVGSPIETLRKGSGVSSQTDVEDKYGSGGSKSSARKKYGSKSADEQKEKTPESMPEKNICANCGSGDECQCGDDANCNNPIEENKLKDPIISMIQDITRRYSKNDIMKIKKKKCFTEIVTVLNYLLETEESTDQEPKSVNITSESSDNNAKKSSKSDLSDGHDKKSKTVYRQSSTSPIRFDNNNKKPSRAKSSSCCNKTKIVLKQSESESLPSKHDKSVQPSSKSASKCTESSDAPCSTDLPSTSDSTACKIFNKIKKECEKYHLRRLKCGRKCEISSSTSVNCDDCKKVHHCPCRHKCKRSKTVDKLQKKCVAYNLILQTSESMLSEETICDQTRPLQNIVVKVPKRKEKLRTETCKETIFKIEKGLKGSPRGHRSRSCPKENEMSSTDDYIRKTQQCTVREYLEKNRPDFVEKSSERQSCLKFINEMRANQRAAHRDLLSLHVDQQPDLTSMSTEQLRQLAEQIGVDMRRKKPAPKFISEREMKKHSEKIYKTLPEVVQKKEDKKKENIKKTNLLLANIFKKNLQKKTLRGTVNLSNYSTVIKI